MGQVYAPPEGFKPPDIGEYMRKDNLKQYDKAVEAYEEKLKTWIKKNFSHVCKNAGEEIRFQVADGYARYIVASLRPVRLIHLDTGDSYRFEYAHRLTAKDIREQIRKEKALDAIFSSKKEN